MTGVRLPSNGIKTMERLLRINASSSAEKKERQAREMRNTGLKLLFNFIDSDLGRLNRFFAFKIINGKEVPDYEAKERYLTEEARKAEKRYRETYRLDVEIAIEKRNGQNGKRGKLEPVLTITFDGEVYDGLSGREK